MLIKQIAELKLKQPGAVELAVDVPSRRLLRAAGQQRIVSARGAIPRVEQGERQLIAPRLPVPAELAFEPADERAIHIGRQAGGRIIGDQIIDVRLVGVEGPGPARESFGHADLRAARTDRLERWIAETGKI